MLHALSSSRHGRVCIFTDGQEMNLALIHQVKFLRMLLEGVEGPDIDEYGEVKLKIFSRALRKVFLKMSSSSTTWSSRARIKNRGVKNHYRL